MITDIDHIQNRQVVIEDDLGQKIPGKVIGSANHPGVRPPKNYQKKKTGGNSLSQIIEDQNQERIDNILKGDPTRVVEALSRDYDSESGDEFLDLN